jgi:uncharacterized protein YgiB involved in biofilm formation
MTSDPIKQPRRRKRSAAAGLSAAGAAAMLSACDPAPDLEQVSRERYGAPTEVAAFTGVAECVASGTFTEDQCNEAQREAWTNDEAQAPRFEDRQTCEEQFGENACQPRTTGGQSFFTPLLTGFMIGQLMDGGRSRYRYSGLYRNNREGIYYHPSGPGSTMAGAAGAATATRWARARSPLRSPPSASRPAAPSSRAAASAAGRAHAAAAGAAAAAASADRFYFEIWVNAPSPRRGEGWGEGARRLRKTRCAVHPHPTLSLKGEGLEVPLPLQPPAPRLKAGSKVGGQACTGAPAK